MILFEPGGFNVLTNILSENRRNIVNVKSKTDNYGQVELIVISLTNVKEFCDNILPTALPPTKNPVNKI